MADELYDLILGCRARDAGAQRELYDRFHRLVYRLAARLVGVADAPDVTQEVFLRVFTGIAGYQGTAAFTTWLYRLTINECQRHTGRRQRRPGPLVQEPVCRAAGPQRALEQADLLERALAQLDDRLRAIFLLREAEGLSYQQIAEVLGAPPGTVASQLSRARAELQEYLRKVEQR
jgi:RNA polymerase sigma-70 factor (ECF subfamily)